MSASAHDSEHLVLHKVRNVAQLKGIGCLLQGMLQDFGKEVPTGVLEQLELLQVVVLNKLRLEPDLKDIGAVIIICCFFDIRQSKLVNVRIGLLILDSNLVKLRVREGEIVVSLVSNELGAYNSWTIWLRFVKQRAQTHVAEELVGK